MKRSLLLVIALLAFPLSALAGHHGPIPINWTLNGVIMDIGVDADGHELKRFDLMLQGSPGGASTRGVGWGPDPVPYDLLPPGHECLDTAMPVDGVLFGEGFQMVVNFKDGSMLFLNSVDGGFLCFAPAIAVGAYEIVGGLGRYEGAGGMIDVYIELHRFGNPSMITAETGVITGEIILP